MCIQMLSMSSYSGVSFGSNLVYGLVVLRFPVSMLFICVLWQPGYAYWLPVPPTESSQSEHSSAFGRGVGGQARRVLSTEICHHIFC